MERVLQPYVVSGSTSKRRCPTTIMYPTHSQSGNSTTTNSYVSNPGFVSSAPSSSYDSSSLIRSNVLPDFSLALDLPPPAHTVPVPSITNSGTSSTGIDGRVPPYNPSYIGGSSIPMTHTGTGCLSSTNYTGGPTGGLVCEGNPMNSHKKTLDYEIKGHKMQIVEIELDPQDTVIAEARSMLYLEEGIDYKMKFGDGSTPNEKFFKKLMAAGGRLLRGESLIERLRIGIGCVVAFTEGIHFDFEFTLDVKSIFLGGESCAILQGTGTVWIQSLPFSRLAKRVLQHAPKSWTTMGLAQSL